MDIISSPEHDATARWVASLKATWCQELSLSLGLEKDYVAQVFCTLRPVSATQSRHVGDVRHWRASSRKKLKCLRSKCGV